MESFDPRFKVEMVAKANSRHFNLHALEDVKCNFRFDLEKIGVDQFENFQRGLPMTLAPGSIEVSGSPLVEEITKLTGRG